MAEDALLIAIEQDARQQADSILGEAEETASEIMEVAEKEVSEAHRQRAEAFAEALDRKAASTINAARTRVGGRGLALRHSMAGEVLRRVEESFTKLSRQSYAAVLNRFYHELKKDWYEDKEPEKHVVLINPADVGLINDAGVEFRADEAVSLGVVFVTEDGRLRYENTVSSRIKRMRDYLQPMIDGILFGKE